MWRRFWAKSKNKHRQISTTGAAPSLQYFIRRGAEYLSTNPVILRLKHSISIENKTQCISPDTQTQGNVGKIYLTKGV